MLLYVIFIYKLTWVADMQKCKSKRKEANERNFMMSKKVRMDSVSSFVLAQPVDDKDVSESASKVKIDKCGGAVAVGVDLESGSDCGQPISFPTAVIIIRR